MGRVERSLLEVGLDGPVAVSREREVLPGGRHRTVPARTRSPSSRFAHLERRLLARAGARRVSVNPTGMWRTIATGTGKSAASRGIRARSACGPPVEMPITTMSTRCGLRGSGQSLGRGAAPPRSRVARRRRATGASAAAFTLAISSSAISNTFVGGERGRLLHEVDGAGVERGQHPLARLRARCSPPPPAPGSPP